MLCRKLTLFKDGFVTIDGSKFKALNNPDRNFTKAKLKWWLQQVDESILRYLSEMERLDQQESDLAVIAPHAERVPMSAAMIRTQNGDQTDRLTRKI